MTSRRSRNTARRSTPATSAAATSCSRCASIDARMSSVGAAVFSSRAFVVAAFVAISLTALIGQSTDWMALANGKLLDFGFAFWRKAAPEPAPRDVVVIGIDVDDLREFSDP